MTTPSLQDVVQRTGLEGYAIRAFTDERDLKKRKTNCPMPMATSLCKIATTSAEGLPGFPIQGKKGLLEERPRRRFEDKPSSSTRSLLSYQATKSTKPTDDRLSYPFDLSTPATSPIVVSNGLISLNGQGRYEDGSVENIASSNFLQYAFIKCIGRTSEITPVSIQVALKITEIPSSFTFSQE